MSMVCLYPLTTKTWDEEEREAILRVVDSGWITIGREVAEFEREFAEYHGRKYGIMVNSGSSANLIATAAFFYKKDRPLVRGDVAIVPAIAWGTTYHPIHQHNLSLRVVDASKDTLNMDVDLIPQALPVASGGKLKKPARLLVGVSILGNPAYLGTMRKIADNYGLYFLEDNCESLDAEVGGRKTGTFGHMSTFSFFFSHQLNTGEGGMILTDDYELAELARSLRSHGLSNHSTPLSPQEEYDFILPGYNVRPLEVTAAVGRVQLRKLPAMTSIRRANLRLFQNFFHNDTRFTIQQEIGRSSSFGFPMVVNDDKKADRFPELLRSNRIEYRMVTGGNILQHKVMAWYDRRNRSTFITRDKAQCCVAQKVHSNGFFVGNYPKDLSVEIRHLHEVLKEL